MQLYGNKNDGKHTGDRRPKSEEEFAAEQRAVDEAMRGNRSGKRKKRKKKGSAVKKILLAILIIAALAAAAWFIFVEFFTEAPEVAPEGREDVKFTFLIVGLDKVGNNTDTIMVARFDTKNDNINVVSLPRDTLINSESSVKKINSVYPASINNGGDGYTALAAAVEKMLGFKVDHIVVIDIQAAAEIVDTIGGVEFDVPVNMNYDDPTQDLHIHINKGLQRLNGEQTVQVLRFRATYGMGDIDRIDVQQSLFRTMASQLISLGNIPNIDELISIAENRVVTYNTHTGKPLTGDNIRYFLKEFLDLSGEDIQFMKMPALNSYCGEICKVSYVFPDIGAWVDMVNERINPYDEKVSYEDLDMVTVMNGNFYYTTEPLRGGVTSFYLYSSYPNVANYGILPYSSILTDEGDN